MSDAQKGSAVEVTLDHLLNHRVCVDIYTGRRLVEDKEFTVIFDESTALRALLA